MLGRFASHNVCHRFAELPSNDLQILEFGSFRDYLLAGIHRAL